MNATIPVAPGTIVLFSDLIDPFAHIAVHRLLTARARHGLDDHVVIDHHVSNERYGSLNVIDAHAAASGVFHRHDRAIG